jgi:hypothetical protein
MNKKTKKTTNKKAGTKIRNANQAVKIAVLTRCMDKRHEARIGDAVRKAIGPSYHFYELTEPGGAGVLADLYPEHRQWLVDKIKLTIDNLHAGEVILTVHGTSDEDSKGCGGYVLNGYGDNYATPEASRAFSIEQLQKASAFLRQHVNVPIRALHVTFKSDGTNIAEEILAM